MKAQAWQITHDPLGLFEGQRDVVEVEEAAREQGEDVLQATRGSSTLDLGWYRDRYRVLLVEAGQWSTPVREIEALDLAGALAAFKNLST